MIPISTSFYAGIAFKTKMYLVFPNNIRCSVSTTLEIIPETCPQINTYQHKLTHKSVK
jgi:hypothetical protein